MSYGNMVISQIVKKIKSRSAGRAPATVRDAPGSILGTSHRLRVEVPIREPRNWGWWHEDPKFKVALVTQRVQCQPLLP